MLEKREYEEAKAFLKDYHQDVSQNARQYCDSAAINAVLNHYMSCCLEERIPAHFSIRIGSKHTMKDTDFCILLGNLLENALAACRMKENIQREITLKVGLTAPHIIVISIRNPYIGIIHQQEGNFYQPSMRGRARGWNPFLWLPKNMMDICRRNMMISFLLSRFYCMFKEAYSVLFIKKISACYVGYFLVYLV